MEFSETDTPFWMVFLNRIHLEHELVGDKVLLRVTLGSYIVLELKHQGKTLTGFSP